MNELEELIKERINSDGPLSLHDYMELALSHPIYGYYQKSTPFGVSGDFVTAPEISQMFAELIGLWCVDCWVKLGTPSKINLVELGPGNGTLMSDALRSAALAPEFMSAVHIHLVETSVRLKELQKKHLSAFDISWHSEFPEFDDAPILVVANEFFDALPIRQFESHDGKWHEKQVSWHDNQFTAAIAQASSDKPVANLPSLSPQEDGTIFETSPASQEITRRIAASLNQNRGAALIIDYGPAETTFGDSFQAVQNHRYVSPYSDPGDSDLTAHVDFESLSKIAAQNNCMALPITSQGRFLERLGIEARAMLLSKQATNEQKEKISCDLKRLISTEEMGTLFKALSFYHSMSAPPAGFGE